MSRVGVGEAFRAFGVFIMEDQHGRAASADFGGLLRFGGVPLRPYRVGDFQEEADVVLVYQRGHFEVTVFDEAHFFNEYSEKPLTLGGYGGGAVGGQGGFQNCVAFGDVRLQFGEGCRGDSPGGSFGLQGRGPYFGHI